MKTPMELLCIILVFTLYAVSDLIDAQYYGEGGGSGGNYHMSNSGYGGGGYGDNQGGSDRPKLHLGLRVRIPAMKFDLPRMSLPKITISAKIRQPSRPRTISLPEINLDTSSKVAAPQGAKNQNGDYGGGNHMMNNGYGGQNQYNSGGGGYASSASSPTQHISFSTGGSDVGGYGGYGGVSGGGGYNSGYSDSKTQTFSISSEEEPSGHGYSNSNNYAANNNNYQQQQQEQQPYEPRNNDYNSNQMRYSSSNNQPMRTLIQLPRYQLPFNQQPQANYLPIDSRAVPVTTQASSTEPEPEAAAEEENEVDTERQNSEGFAEE